MQPDQVHLLDMLQAAQLAMDYLRGVSREQFLSSVQIQDSVIRRLEIIGEAARRVSLATREAQAQIPWIEMIGMRNLMIHEYDGVDLVVVWETVMNDLPRLAEQLQPLVSPE